MGTRGRFFKQNFDRFLENQPDLLLVVSAKFIKRQGFKDNLSVENGWKASGHNLKEDWDEVVERDLEFFKKF